MFVAIIVGEYMRDFFQQLKFHMYPQQPLLAMHVSSNIRKQTQMIICRETWGSQNANRSLIVLLSNFTLVIVFLSAFLHFTTYVYLFGNVQNIAQK